MVLLIFFLLLPRLSEAEYKMLTTWGAPEPRTSYPKFVYPNTNWSDCVKWCLGDVNCIVSYGDNTRICVMYYTGEVVQIKKHSIASATVEKISMKVFTSTCTKEFLDMLPTETTSEGPDSELSYRIEDGGLYYNFVYNSPNLLSCNIWTNPQLQCTGCPKTMLSFRGTIVDAATVIGTGTSSWYACMLACYLEPNCAMAEIRQTGGCNMYKYGEVKKFTYSDDYSIQTPTAALSFIAMKYISDTSSCSINFPDIFNGKTLDSEKKDFSVFKTTWLQDGTISLTWTARPKTCDDSNMFKITDMVGCYSIVFAPCTHKEANDYCASNGGDGLMTIPDEASLNEIVAKVNTFVFTRGYLHVGMRKETPASDWVWDLTHLAWDDSVYQKSKDTLNQGSGLYSALAMVPEMPNVLHSKRENDVEMGYICHLAGRTF